MKLYILFYKSPLVKESPPRGLEYKILSFSSIYHCNGRAINCAMLFVFISTVHPQPGDLRLSGPSPGQGVGVGGRVHILKDHGRSQSALVYC
ncbi:hypothetical protein PoB_006944600 [Plakobranchus ocellatus]|uniref:Uncharacterized protein n=1 Tax=Plakobranchus ocellatus TaxID=259542 RepID=A0AAV4DFK0_9GAST|nr:hypothetical protein PoB_006944600 [Plakobranchus ocellatus]